MTEKGGNMVHANPIYGVINPKIVQEEYRQQHYNNQIKKTFDCEKN